MRRTFSPHTLRQPAFPAAIPQRVIGTMPAHQAAGFGDIGVGVAIHRAARDVRCDLAARPHAFSQAGIIIGDLKTFTTIFFQVAHTAGVRFSACVISVSKVVASRPGTGGPAAVVQATTRRPVATLIHARKRLITTGLCSATLAAGQMRRTHHRACGARSHRLAARKRKTVADRAVLTRPRSVKMKLAAGFHHS